MSNEPLYTLKEAADKLGTYPKLLRSLIKKYKVPFRIIGGLWILDDSGIDLLRPLVADYQDRLKPFSKLVTT